MLRFQRVVAQLSSKVMQRLSETAPAMGGSILAWRQSAKPPAIGTQPIPAPVHTNCESALPWVSVCRK